MTRLAHRVRSAATVLGLFAALAPLACSQRPLVEVRRLAPAHSAVRLVAVAPFYPAPSLSRSRGVKDESAWAAAALVSRFMAEALANRGFTVIAPSELETAFIGEGAIVPRGDGLAAASVASRNFGATGVLLGEVFRYRERSGTAVGSEQPASIAFRVTLFSAPEGRKVWVAEFDETQPSVTGDILRARQYPGRGSRWLTVAELAQFGARQVAGEMPQPGVAPQSDPGISE
ncbi:MAG: hypothetical protein ACQGVK_25225 [Myxococcota bacterium]